MSKAWKQFRTWASIVSCCIIVLGILIVIWPDISAVVVCFLLGILCIAGGAYELVRYFKLGFVGVFFRFDLTLGICSILIGILLLIHPTGAIAFLPIAVGLYIIMSSVFDIQMSVGMRRFGMGNWWMSMVLGVLGTIFAFLLFVDPFSGAFALMIFVGVSLIISGIQNLYLITCILKTIKSVKIHEDDGNNVVIDADWSNVD